MELTQKQLKQLINYCPSTGKMTYNIKVQNMDIGSEAGNRKSVRYKQICINYKRYYIHRLVWLYMFGYFPKGSIDHIDHDTLNNKFENLREVPHSVNQKNLKLDKRNKSGYSGVRKLKVNGRWIASINNKGKNISLGCYGTKKEAVDARKRGEVKYGFHSNHGLLIKRKNLL